MNISVILVEPQEPGNIGAIARSMANFDFSELILINPKCDHMHVDARKRSVHATHILEKAKVMKWEDLKKEFDYLIATTSNLGTDYNLTRLPMHPWELSKKIKKKNTKIGLVFGRESHGLYNREIDFCDYLVSIPTSKKYDSMNLSHAATIIFYEIYKSIGENKITSHVVMATKVEKEVIMKNFNEIIDSVEFSTDEKKETQQLVWKRLFSKAMLTKREAFAVIGMLKKIKEK